MRKLLLLMMLTFTYGHSDTIGGEVSFNIFSHSPSGQASYDLLALDEGTLQDIEDTFGFGTEQDIAFKGYLEHPFPFLPNIKLGYTSLSHKGTQSVDGFSWGNLSNITGNISNKLSLDMTDTTLYYELLDNWTEVDAGLTFRHISGDMGVNTKLSSELINFSTTTPMLYTRLRAHIPSTDISLGLEANAIAFSGVNSYDYELSARYTFYMGLGLEAGYKSMHIENDDFVDHLDVNIDFSGPYAAVSWDF